MIFKEFPVPQNSLRAAITEAYRADESACVEALLEAARFPSETLERITHTPRKN